MKINLHYLYIGIISALIILMLLVKVQSCNQHKQLINQISQYELKEKEFKTQRLKDSSTIVTQEQTNLTLKEAYRLGLIEKDKQMAKIQSQIQEQSQIAVRGKDVPYIPKGYVDTTGKHLVDTSGWVHDVTGHVVRTDSVSVPMAFGLSEKWFKVKGTVKKEGLTIDTLIMPNKMIATIGIKKTGFLNLGRTPVVTVKNTNPYIEVSGLNNVVVKKKKGILKSPFFWGTVVGLVGGIFITK